MISFYDMRKIEGNKMSPFYNVRKIEGNKMNSFYNVWKTEGNKMISFYNVPKIEGNKMVQLILLLQIKTRGLLCQQHIQIGPTTVWFFEWQSEPAFIY